MLDITTTGRGYCVTTYCSKINVSTVSYKYWLYLFYHKIHLLSFVYSYCTLIDVINAISLCFIYNLHRTLLFSQITNKLLFDVSNHKLCYRQINPQYINFLSPPQSNHRRIDTYMGCSDCGEWYHNSDIYFLPSDNFRQYTSITNQC